MLTIVDEFIDLRSTAPLIAAMFDKLSTLDQAPQDGAVNAMIQCGLGSSDFNKPSSQMLDSI